MQAAHRDARLRRGWRGRSRTGSERLRSSRRVASSIPVCSLRKPDVAEDQVDFLALEHFDRLVEIVDRRDDLIAGIAEHVFVVERGQRLVLDDEDPLDDLLAPAEQHRDPDK